MDIIDFVGVWSSTDDQTAPPDYDFGAFNRNKIVQAPRPWQHYHILRFVFLLLGF